VTLEQNPNFGIIQIWWKYCTDDDYAERWRVLDNKLQAIYIWTESESERREIGFLQSIVYHLWEDCLDRGRVAGEC